MAAVPEIRELTPCDVDEIVAAFGAIGWAKTKPVSLYERYLEERDHGQRVVWVAFVDTAFAGYVTVNWESLYPPFREASTPEIQDLNVLPQLRRRGVGSALLECAEHGITDRSGVAGIGVGLGEAYGAAQRLYVQRGYVPDGRGVTYRYRTLREGDETRIDDEILLWFTRKLGS